MATPNATQRAATKVPAASPPPGMKCTAAAIASRIATLRVIFRRSLIAQRVAPRAARATASVDQRLQPHVGVLDSAGRSRVARFGLGSLVARDPRRRVGQLGFQRLQRLLRGFDRALGLLLIVEPVLRWALGGVPVSARRYPPRGERGVWGPGRASRIRPPPKVTRGWREHARR